MTYDPEPCDAPSLVVIVKPFTPPPPDVYEKGVRVALVPIVRNHPSSVNPLIKSNNLLNNALATQEAFRRGAFDAVMRNYRGELSECSTSNLFVVKDGALLTPPLEAGLLAGITREFVLELAPEAGIAAREIALRDPDLLGAEECFLTSSTKEIVPIVGVDDAVIGSGRPGPVTGRLRDLVQSEGRGPGELELASPARHRRTGFLAAAASSNRLRRVVSGALFSFSGSVSASAAMAIIASMKRSSSAIPSLSVGSIMSAPCTISGK